MYISVILYIFFGLLVPHKHSNMNMSDVLNVVIKSALLHGQTSTPQASNQVPTQASMKGGELNVTCVDFADCAINLACISGKCSPPSEMGGPCDDDDQCSLLLSCDLTYGNCTDHVKFVGKPCKVNTDCERTEECDWKEHQCVKFAFQKRCASDDDCPRRPYEGCVDNDEYGYSCQIVYRESCDGKCTGTAAKCNNMQGPAVCSCEHPYKGEPPNCNMNCEKDYDCFGEYKCKDGGKCVHGCDGECISLMTPMSCSASGHGHTCWAG